MKFQYKGHTYKLLLRKRILPVAVIEIVPELQGTPTDYKLNLNGSKLQGKVALITGAHRGIGYHIALRLLQEGAKVIITGRNEEALKNTIHQLNTPNAAYLVWDIAGGEENEHFNEAMAIFGSVDILVNNAGVNKIEGVSMSFEEATKDYIHRMNDINVLGTVDLCEAYVKLFSKGTILNIVSNTAVRPAVGIYWMSKWAIYDYTKALSEKQKDSEITINGLCPGPTMTDMMFDEKSSIYYPSMATKRMALPEEIAEMAFMQILSGLNGKNGEMVVCDGGESLA